MALLAGITHGKTAGQTEMVAGRFPDIATFGQHQYGNRVGVYRVLDVLEAAGSPVIGYPRQGSAWADIKAASDRAGSADATTLWAGQAAALAGDEISASEVVAQIMAEAETTLRRLTDAGWGATS